MMDIHAVIGKLPRPKGGFTLPKHRYTGPYNPLDKQLDKNDQPIPVKNRIMQSTRYLCDTIYAIEIMPTRKEENINVMIKC